MKTGYIPIFTKTLSSLTVTFWITVKLFCFDNRRTSLYYLIIFFVGSALIPTQETVASKASCLSVCLRLCTTHTYTHSLRWMVSFGSAFTQANLARDNPASVLLMVWWWMDGGKTGRGRIVLYRLSFLSCISDRLILRCWVHMSLLWCRWSGW